MNYIQTKTYYTTLKNTNTELLTYGYQLTKEDWKELLICVKNASSKFELIETSTKPLKQLTTTFSKSPYCKDTTFLPLLKNQLYSYYAIRSLFNWRIKDELIVETMYNVYIRYHGVISIAYVQQCATVLKETL